MEGKREEGEGPNRKHQTMFSQPPTQGLQLPRQTPVCLHGDEKVQWDTISCQYPINKSPFWSPLSFPSSFLPSQPTSPPYNLTLPHPPPPPSPRRAMIYGDKHQPSRMRVCSLSNSTSQPPSILCSTFSTCRMFSDIHTSSVTV